MNVTDDRETDKLVVALREVAIEESEEVRSGVIAVFGAEGGVVRFEVLRASQVIEDAERAPFATTE